MNAHPSPKIFIYTALPCEAKPLIDFYRLKKDTNIQRFAVYGNNGICLTVTGIGKSAMAAGVAYTQALFSSTQIPVLLNVGIAGHKGHPIGSVFLVDKISDSDSDRRYYPPLVFTPPCATHSLQTAAKPQHSYPPVHLCDMEGSAFYETAVRFSSGELAHCLKIVSDNESSPIKAIQPAQVSLLISAQLSIIETILTTLSQLAEALSTPELNEFNRILNRFHFTANEQTQLKKLLSRWHLVTGQDRLEFAGGPAKTGKEFLKLLNQSLSGAEFYL
jgi:adenosylhomocysteine nucleosidase